MKEPHNVEEDLSQISEEDFLKESRKIRRRRNILITVAALFMAFIIILYYARFLR